jgi:anaerobic magnesium-protoporphyrin IX monomethyl ester cyclase
MNIILINNPQKAYNFINFNMPNLGLLSIASNLDKRHKVKIIDNFYDPLIVNKHFSKKDNENYNMKNYDIIKEYKPDIIGLTAMSFQYNAAKKLAKNIKENFKDIIVVLGGYHATLMYNEIYDSDDKKYFDFIVRKEGEIAFNDLVNKIEFNKEFSDIKGMSYCIDGRVYHNSDMEDIDLDKINLPNRTLLGNNTHYWYNYITNKYESAAVLETSRGCLVKKYGNSFRKYDLNRVIDDINNIKKNKDIERVVIIDDNITLDIERLENLCDLIIKNKLNSFKYFVQANSIGLLKSKKLIKKMKLAGFDWVFLGIENVNKNNLNVLESGDIINESKIAIKYLNKYGIASWGGGIIGAPEDSKKEIKKMYKTYSNYKVTFPGVQILNPYPKGEIGEKKFVNKSIANMDNYEVSEGYWPNIKTNYLSCVELFYHNFIEQIRFEFMNKGLLSFYLKNNPFKFAKSLVTNHINSLMLKLYIVSKKKINLMLNHIEFLKKNYLERINYDLLLSWTLNKDKFSELMYEYTDGIKKKTITIKYNRSSDGWWGIGNWLFMNSLENTGIEFFIKGTSNIIRIQIEDLENKLWVYNILPHSEWEKVKIPFSYFEFREDYQRPKIPGNKKLKISNLLLYYFIHSNEGQLQNGEFSIDEIKVY